MRFDDINLIDRCHNIQEPDILMFVTNIQLKQIQKRVRILNDSRRLHNCLHSCDMLRENQFPRLWNDLLFLKPLRHVLDTLKQTINWFDVHRAVHLNTISVAKPTRCTSVSNLFYFGMTLCMFRRVFPSIIRSSRLYIQQQAYVKQILLAACSSKQTAVSVWQMSVAVCTVLNSWWWTERPSETCTVSFQNKINLIHWCILLVLLQK